MSVTNLYVDDKDIRVSKSSFAIYPGETTKYEGKTVKMRMGDLTIILQKRPEIIDALSYEVLNTISYFHFTTSRQITDYLNLVKSAKVEQSQVSKKLEYFSRFSIITKYSYVNENKEQGTNMKVYGLDNNGKNLLTARKYECNWQHTDALDMMVSKWFLIRNQYLIKLLKECSKLENIKLKEFYTGVGLYYTTNSVNHVLIPVRRYENFKEDLIKTYEKLSSDRDFITRAPEKIMFIGEDSRHIYEIFAILYKQKLITKDTYFISDLRLFDRDLSKSFVRFGFRKTNETTEVSMLDDIISDFN